MENDIHLIRLILKGDQAAFGLLVQQYKDYVFSICLRILKKREEAEEAAQDTFLKVYRMLASFKEKSKFSTWLYTIAYRTSLDHARKKKIRIQAIGQTEKDAPPLQLAGEPEKQPDSQMDAQDLKYHLGKAIRALPAVDASIITLFYLNEMSVKEVAQITGMTETNIKTKLHRLRERLKVKLNHYLESEIQDLI